MFELPDKRAILILAFPIVLGLLSAYSSSHVVDCLLYLSITIAGLAFLVIDYREGHCLNRPSVTRVESPVFFWSEMLASLFFVVMGLSKLWDAL
jgi:hypothetical protein